MSRWFRLYDEMLDDPKMQRLPPATFKAVINLWCLASKNGGKLPCFEDIAFGLRMEQQAAVALLDELVASGLLDHDDEGIRPHNWDKRQYKSDVTDPTAAERMRRHRNAHRNDTVTVTPPRTDTESEQIQKEKDAVADAPAPTQAELERELFRRGKQVCGKASGGLLASLLKSREHDVALARSVIELAATKDDPRSFVAAAIKGFGNRGGGYGKPGKTDWQLAIEQLKEAEADLRSGVPPDGPPTLRVISNG